VPSRRTKCPTCRSPVDRSGEHRKTFPFCSDRCRAADLGGWLDGTFRIPDVPDEDDAAILAEALRKEHP